MKNWIIWSFERRSFQYDVLCGLILIAIFAIPPAVFNDRPDYMRLSDAAVRRALDDDGNPVYTVKVTRRLIASSDPEAEQGARETLREFLPADDQLEITRVEPIKDTRGVVAAYAFWVGP